MWVATLSQYPFVLTLAEADFAYREESTDHLEHNPERPYTIGPVWGKELAAYNPVAVGVPPDAGVVRFGARRRASAGRSGSHSPTSRWTSGTHM